MASKKKAGTVTPNVVSFPTTAAATPAPIMFGSLIKERRKKAKLSQKDFADMMHVTRNTIINWEADKSKPDYSLIPEVCSLLNIQIHELFHMQAENGLSDLEDRVVGNIRLLNPTSVPEEAPEYVFLRKNHINAKADGIALVDGKSMEPVYHDGDYVYYEEVSAADPGEDVLVDTEDGAVIKRVDDDYTLYSVNPAIPYPKKSDQNTLVIRGRVLGVVASSDRPSKDDISILEELFIDEIREFNEEHGVNE